MRRKNRKPIASIENLPQFTTMNVIEGQAGLVKYSSLIFYSLTLDNILNIIVLLILAGVTIATLTGENGILTRASQASEQTEIEEEKEAIGLAYTGVLADNNGSGVSDSELQNELQKNGYNATVTDNGDGTLTVTFESGREYTIDENGNISEPTISNIIATMKIVGEKVETPPLPSSDFTHTEGTVDTGYVIQDSNGNEFVWVPSSDFTHTEGTVDTGYVIQDSNGNEFVWVPVDKNQKIQINVTSKSGNIESISLTDPYGDEITLPDTDNLGTSYSNTEIEPTNNGKYINGTYKLSVTVGEETKEVELNVKSLYAKRMWELELFTDEVAQKLGYENAEDYYNNSMYASSGMTLEQVKSMLPTMYKNSYQDTEDYTKQVNENGGFYIGRYEASYENGSVVSKESTVANTGSTLENGKLWNWISQTDALSYANSMYTSSEFTSSLLTGAAWDRTLSWLEETGAVSLEEIIVDSKSWGNYRDDTFSGTTSLINTGSMPQTRVNNIYDLAGNLFEWTTEANATDYRVIRGRWLLQQWFW